MSAVYTAFCWPSPWTKTFGWFRQKHTKQHFGPDAVAAAAAKSRQCLTLCDHIDRSPPGSCPWDSPGKNTGVGCHFLLQMLLSPIISPSWSTEWNAPDWKYQGQGGKIKKTGTYHVPCVIHVNCSLSVCLTEHDMSQECREDSLLCLPQKQ